MADLGDHTNHRKQVGFMIRRLAVLGALPAIVELGIATGASPAQAAPTPSPAAYRATVLRAAAKMQPHAAGSSYGTCSLVPPARVRVVQQFALFNNRLTGGCVLHNGPSAIWYIGDSLGQSISSVLFDHETSGVAPLFAETPLGQQTWKGWIAFDAEGHNYTQNTPTTTFKVGSWAGLQTSRSGSKVTIDTRAVRYATSLDYNIPWANETGVIQYRAKGGSAWTSLKSFTTNSAGATSYSYTSTATRDYRAVYTEQSTIWGATSPTSQR
ncbi:hypothetical protein [Allobranchiibius sp. GilTou73]|uniref:hypothetical protein n=1 Tax=Allobranchiibius sp. GilTou73 TaxID=2904523 RepID=UPI001F295E30|nr:hypothetical protein [Allobranchiibius sp. GilTou73]UIJ33960.1 hypothetical protein LVQ62_12525 [Allobranchiibius sp. GilTou73]